jgi:hypothetical protein
MSKTIEVKYFNSFLLKKTLKAIDGAALWCGDPANPDFYPLFPVEVDNTTEAVINKNWFVEEARMYGGFNEDEVDLGVRAYLVNDDEDNLELTNSLIYSGIFNNRTGVNNTNVFSVSEDITKSLDPRYGSIQRLYAEDSNLLIFQESKVNAVLIDKDALYTAEGDSNVTSSNSFLGDIRQYMGEYGIGRFPESFSVDGGRKYYADVPNSAIMRLSADGNTEISKYGMEDWFKDNLQLISPEYKRFVFGITWTIPWSTPTSVITVGGDNISQLDYGMTVEGISGYNLLYITDIGTETDGEVDITLNKSITVTASPQPSVLTCAKLVKDKVVGGYDAELDNYVISISYNPPSLSVESGLVVLSEELDSVPIPILP